MKVASIVVVGTETRRYAPDQLLRLRDSVPADSGLLDKLKNHPDLEMFSGRNSDASGKAKNLLEITNRQKSRYNAKYNSSDSLRDSESLAAPDHTTIQDHRQAQWNFRKRDNSDRASQPHSAPTGLAAQQSENFQRFYRAVVSPTHVRVTAGGRIVPNTRAIAPPIFEWNSDKFLFEPRKPVAELESRQLQPNIWHHNPFAVAHTSLIPGGFVPAFNFIPRQPAMMMQPMANLTHPGTPDAAPLEGSQSPNPNGETTNNVPHAAFPQQIKFSHPSQFDHTKPFTLNGQVVYPLPPGSQPPPNAVAVNLPGNTNLMMHQTAAGFFPAQFPSTLGGFPNSLYQNGQQPPLGLPATGHGFEAMLQAPLHPGLIPMGLDPASGLLDVHIQNLRNHLKAIEGDIVDKKPTGDALNFLEQQRQGLIIQIHTAESLKQNQLAQEELAKKLTADTILQATTPSHSNSPKVSSGHKHEVTANENGVSKPAMRPDPTTKSRLTMAAAKAPPFKPRSQARVVNTNGYGNGVASQDIAKNGNGMPPETFHDGSTQPQVATATPSYQRVATFMSPEPKAASGIGSFHASAFMSPEPKAPSSSSHIHTFMSPAPTPVVPSMPYLIGAYPPGIAPDQVKSEDMLYSRPLTEDEVRARFLYWGKAPRSVTVGLPKFDGKNFYPPSPVKEIARIAHSSQLSSSSVETMASTPQAVDFGNLFFDNADPAYKTPSPAHHLNGVRGIRPLVPVPQPVFEQTPNVPEGIFLQNGGSNLHDGGIATSFYAQNGEVGVRETFTPPCRALHHATSTDDGFGTQLFTERGVPGYKSPSPVMFAKSSNGDGGSRNSWPVTPNHLRIRTLGRDDDDVTIGSWGKGPARAAEHGTPESLKTESTIEIQLSPKVKSQSFAERVENFRSTDQHARFLQNMLKSRPSMTGTALLGVVTSATAQGNLPQYRGTAAASLAPAMLNGPSTEREVDYPTLKTDTTKEAIVTVSPMVVSSFMSENRPLRAYGSTEALGAEGNMLYLTREHQENL